MPPIIGHVLFDVYEDEKRIDPTQIKQKLLATFGNQIDVFKALLVDHVITASKFTDTNKTKFNDDAFDLVMFVKAKVGPNQQLPDSMVMAYNRKRYEIKFVALIGETEDLASRVDEIRKEQARREDPERPEEEDDPKNVDGGRRRRRTYRRRRKSRHITRSKK